MSEAPKLYDSQGKEVVWVKVQCVTCKKTLCKAATAEIIDIPIVQCQRCYEGAEI